MGNQWVKVVIDAEDPARLARWWAEALDYRITRESPQAVEIRPVRDIHGEVPGITFIPVPAGKRGRNRLHLHLRPDDQDAEVERLVNMGARHPEEGESREPGAVMLTDPEGNEFCVQRAIPAPRSAATTSPAQPGQREAGAQQPRR